MIIERRIKQLYKNTFNNNIYEFKDIKNEYYNYFFEDETRKYAHLDYNLNNIDTCPNLYKLKYNIYNYVYNELNHVDSKYKVIYKNMQYLENLYIYKINDVVITITNENNKLIFYNNIIIDKSNPAICKNISKITDDNYIDIYDMNGWDPSKTIVTYYKKTNLIDKMYIYNYKGGYYKLYVYIRKKNNLKNNFNTYEDKLNRAYYNLHEFFVMNNMYFKHYLKNSNEKQINNYKLILFF